MYILLWHQQKNKGVEEWQKNRQLKVFGKTIGVTHPNVAFCLADFFHEICLQEDSLYECLMIFMITKVLVLENISVEFGRRKLKMIFYEDWQDETLWHLASLEKMVRFRACWWHARRRRVRGQQLSETYSILIQHSSIILLGMFHVLG